MRRSTMSRTAPPPTAVIVPSSTAGSQPSPKPEAPRLLGTGRSPAAERRYGAEPRTRQVADCHSPRDRIIAPTVQAQAVPGRLGGWVTGEHVPPHANPGKSSAVRRWRT